MEIEELIIHSPKGVILGINPSVAIQHFRYCLGHQC
ncbi:MAG: hypothetical protein DDT24_00765 [Chloroflexi bacterium]|nr:hypothetical protein [Chloroflexota bacterium]